jgi:hypothetical protein
MSPVGALYVDVQRLLREHTLLEIRYFLFKRKPGDQLHYTRCHKHALYVCIYRDIYRGFILPYSNNEN